MWGGVTLHYSLTAQGTLTTNKREKLYPYHDMDWPKCYILLDYVSMGPYQYVARSVGVGATRGTKSAHG